MKNTERITCAFCCGTRLREGSAEPTVPTLQDRVRALYTRACSFEQYFRNVQELIPEILDALEPREQPKLWT